MKNLIICFLLLMTAVTIGQAQDDKGYIGFSLGPSFPLGDFASKNTYSDEAGLAKTGAIFDITFAYKLGPGDFGIAALLRGQANPVDVDKVADELAFQVPGVNWSVKSNSWSTGAFLVGGFGTFPVSEKVSFDIRGMIGFLNAIYPESSISATDSGISYWIQNTSSSAITFAYLIGAGFKFDVGSKLLLLANFDYMDANPEFTNIIFTSSDGTRQSLTLNQSMVTLNLSLGIAVKI